MKVWSLHPADSPGLQRRTPMSAPQADVAHGLAGGAALGGGEVELAAGANAHLEHGLLLDGLTRRAGVDAKWEASKFNAAGI